MVYLYIVSDPNDDDRAYTTSKAAREDAKDVAEGGCDCSVSRVKLAKLPKAELLAAVFNHAKYSEEMITVHTYEGKV